MPHIKHPPRMCCWIILALLLMSCQQPEATSIPTRASPSVEPTALARVTPLRPSPSVEPTAPARLTPHPDYAETVTTLINRERMAAGCPALTPTDTLIQVAVAHSQDMALHRFIDHEGGDGRTPAQRVQDAGYQFRIVAENVAAGRLAPEGAVRAWMESPEHRANILNCELRETGVGVVEAPDDLTYGIYWTQLFGTPLGS